jgi:hypothetical protein
VFGPIALDSVRFDPLGLTLFTISFPIAFTLTLTLLGLAFTISIALPLSFEKASFTIAIPVSVSVKGRVAWRPSHEGV